jgi:hypothetical protein
MNRTKLDNAPYFVRHRSNSCNSSFFGRPEPACDLLLALGWQSIGVWPLPDRVSSYHGVKGNMTRSLILLVALSSSCFSFDYWNGTKEGMSKAALMKLYGKRLKPSRYNNEPWKPYPEAWIYTTDSPESFCGGNFTPTFYFDQVRPKRGLVAVDLDLDIGAYSKSIVGDCLLNKYTAKYGRPKTSMDVPVPGAYYFSGGRIVLYIYRDRVTITYTSTCHWWQLLCDGWGF